MPRAPVLGTRFISSDSLGGRLPPRALYPASAEQGQLAASTAQTCVAYSGLAASAAKPLCATLNTICHTTPFAISIHLSSGPDNIMQDEHHAWTPGAGITHVTLSASLFTGVEVWSTAALSWGSSLQLTLGRGGRRSLPSGEGGICRARADAGCSAGSPAPSDSRPRISCDARHFDQFAANRCVPANGPVKTPIADMSATGLCCEQAQPAQWCHSQAFALMADRTSGQSRLAEVQSLASAAKLTGVKHVVLLVKRLHGHDQRDPVAGGQPAPVSPVLTPTSASGHSRRCRSSSGPARQQQGILSAPSRTAHCPWQRFDRCICEPTFVTLSSACKQLYQLAVWYKQPPSLSEH